MLVSNSRLSVAATMRWQNTHTEITMLFDPAAGLRMNRSGPRACMTRSPLSFALNANYCTSVQKSVLGRTDELILKEIFRDAKKKTTGHQLLTAS